MRRNLNVKKFENNLRKEFVKLCCEGYYIELGNFNVDYSTATTTIKVVFGKYGLDREEYSYQNYYFSELSQKVNIGIFLGGIISMFDSE